MVSGTALESSRGDSALASASELRGIRAGAPSKEDGPVERLRNAGWELIQWRDFEGDWQRPPFDRERRIDALVQQLRGFADLSDGPSYQYDAFCLDTRPARQLSEEIARTEKVAPRDYSRLEGALVDLCRNRQFRQARKGSGKQYRPGVLREDATRARDELQAELNRFESDANADLAALLREELRACADTYEQAKAKAGALDFLDLLLKARNLVRDDAEVRRSFQQRFKRLFVDEFQDTDPLQAEILLLLAADDPAVTDWRKVRPIPGKLFIVGDPKQSIYRFRRADVGIYRKVYEMLQAAGAKPVTLRTSFRARPNIQRTINAAFAPAMTGDVQAAQAGYVPLEPFRSDSPEQPSVIVLPVPEPYGKQRIANTSIEESLPDAVGAYVHWLIHDSNWKVSTGFRPGEKQDLVPIHARHICLLFRRFVSFGEDMTRPYVRALEARGVPHLLVGGRSFHNRGEIETLRAALAAIEWPDDELSVFATLRGALFAIGDEELLEYRHQFGHFHPFRIPLAGGAAPAAAAPVDTAPVGAASVGVASVVPGFSPALAADRRRAFSPPTASSLAQPRVRRDDDLNAARGDARARPLCARAWRRAGAGECASRRRARAPLRSGWRDLVPRVYRGAAGAGRRRPGRRGADS